MDGGNFVFSLFCLRDACADSKQVRHLEGTEKAHVGYFRMSPFRTLSPCAGRDGTGS